MNDLERWRKAMAERENAKAEMTAHLEKAKAIAAKAEADKRDFTPQEKSEVESHMEKAKELRPKAMVTLEGLASIDDGTTPWTGRKAESWGDTVVQAVQKAASLTGSYGAKALVAAGSVPVPQPFTGGIIETPRRSNFIQDLLRQADRVRTIEGTDRFTFWRQTVRTFNAAPVAPGGLKPTSTITIQRAEDRARVIAHLSEPINESDLADFQDLKSFINAEMELGLAQALASQIISGDGLGENLTGIRNASGVQVHSRGTDDLLTAYRKARGKLENMDVPLDGAVYLMHPNDSEDLDLLKDAEGRFYFQGPREGDSDKLWKVPVVTSKEVPEGEQVLMDLSAVELVERESPQIAVGQPGDLFQRNQVQVRAEGRYGLAVERAFLIVRITA